MPGIGYRVVDALVDGLANTENDCRLLVLPAVLNRLVRGSSAVSQEEINDSIRRRLPGL